MLISWLTKFSLLDYPWKISCIVFTPWCNMRCKFCHNSEFVLPEKIQKLKKNFILEEDFFKFLETRKWLLDWVSICWGEPTLQKDLLNFCKKVKKMWFLVKLDTNWRDSSILKKLIYKKLVDYIAMDIKYPLKKYSFLTWVNEDMQVYLYTINIILNSNIDYEFRTTVIKWYHRNKDIEEIVKLISWAKNYYLQNYNWWNTLENNFDWKSFSKEELDEFVMIWKDRVKNIWIRM